MFNLQLLIPRATAVVVACLAYLFVGGGAAARGAGTEERAFLWQQANSAMGEARSRDDFAAAAAVYADLIAAGARNAAVFHNEGTALLMASRHDNAARSFQQAERYAGSRPDVIHNLELAAAGSTAPASLLPWYRVPLFWHYALPCATRTMVVATAFAMLWIAGAIRLLGRPVLARTLAAWSGVVLMLFGSSVAATLHAESKSERDREVARLFKRTMAPAAPQPAGGQP